MTLKHLLVAAGIAAAEVAGDAEILGVQIDSRLCGAGSLFVCMPETTRPSESFISAAAERGASAAIVYSREGMELAVANGLAAALIPHRDQFFSFAIAKLCDIFFDHPTRKIKLVGVTGTNGKTTTAWIVTDILRQLGHKAAYLGTLGLHLPGRYVTLENTTPFAVDLYNYIDQAVKSGVDTLAIEVSSHALAQNRVDGLEFDVAVLTNITQDHLDFHGTMEQYAASKHRLFTGIGKSTKSLVAVFNIDDSHGLRWSIEQNGPSVTYAVKSQEADLWGQPLEIEVDHLLLNLFCRGEAQVRVPLGGAYNVENTLSAVAAVIALGYRLEEIAPTLSGVRPVPGRFEPVMNDKGISVLVDYAHTSDALEKLLDSVKGVAKGRVITVFGCGGDRDRTKRPKMAKSASERSDLTVVTSDNPRTEDPMTIIAEVLAGIVPGRESVTIPDRADAVAHAIKVANAGDVVVIAGKGHENYQIIGRTKHHMDDRELAVAALEAVS